MEKKNKMSGNKRILLDLFCCFLIETVWTWAKGGYSLCPPQTGLEYFFRCFGGRMVCGFKDKEKSTSMA